jgi:LysR family transcriptional regulator, glycine cleavage system transcriptional activator
MSRRLPPLNALRAFESGARHLNFTRAADDLSVTPTAISHQVRQLEEWFGVSLFERGKRKLSLTDAGAQLYPAVSEALDRIAEVACRIRQTPPRAGLTVSVTPTFGSRWLAARLGKFWLAHPDVDLRIHHSTHLVDLERDDVNLAIRWGLGGWPGVRTEWLMNAVAVPLCSPRLLEGNNPLREITDLRNHVLLHERDHQEWIEWLIAAGLDETDGRRGPVLDDPNSLVRAAVEGHGVFLGFLGMMTAEIESGDLVAPFAGSGEGEPAYYLVYRDGALDNPVIRAFREFIIAEASAPA